MSRPASSQGGLVVQGACKCFGRTAVLQGVDLVVPVGQTHAIIGPNGAGKSTLFNVVSGMADASAGAVYLDGHDITRAAPHQINRLGLSRSFQVTNVFGKLSVTDNLRCAARRSAGVGYALWSSRRARERVAHKVDGLLVQLGLQALAHKPAGELTYAEQRALELGLVLITDAHVVLLDEPTAGMNRTEAARMTRLIQTLCTGKALLVVEHDMQVVFDLADQISVLVQGKVLASGTPASIRQDPAVRQAYLGQTTWEGV